MNLEYQNINKNKFSLFMTSYNFHLSMSNNRNWFKIADEN